MRFSVVAERPVAGQDEGRADGRVEQPHGLEQNGRSLLLDKSPGEQNRPPLPLLVSAVAILGIEFDAVAMHEQFVRREAAGQEFVADIVRNADEQRRLALQGGEPTLEDGRRQRRR